MTDYDAYDEEGNAAREEAHARETERERLLMQESTSFIMSDERGRRFMWWLLGRCHVYATSFTGNSATFFKEGERNIGLMVLDRVMTECPDLYPEMHKEAMLEQARREAEEGKRK